MKKIIKKLIVFLLGWWIMTVSIAVLSTMLTTGTVIVQIFSAMFIVLLYTLILLWDYIINQNE